MQTFTLLLCLATATGTFANAILERTGKDGCHANNCLRQIRGSEKNPPLSVRLADCSSYQMYTVTPEPTTVYTTTTVATTTPIGTVIPYGYHNKRGDKAHTTPAYATQCDNAAAYASACSCVGITATTVTSGSTATITITATATATATATPTGVSFACSPADSSSKCGGACDGVCFPDVNGKGWCKQNKACEGLTACKTNSDCSSRVCLVNGCGSVCADMTYFCPNPANSKILFTKPKHVDHDVKQEKISKHH